MSEALSGLHAAHGTDLRCGMGVEGTDHVTGVRLVDGTVLPADLVVAGIGASPTTDWLEGSGLELDNGLVADETLATALPGVYGAGDIVRWRNLLFDESPTGGLMRIEHWTSAAEQGAAAARNALAPADARPYETVPYFWSDWYDSRIQFVGVPAGDEVVVVSGSVDAQKFVALYRTGDQADRCLDARPSGRRHEVPRPDRRVRVLGRCTGVRRAAQRRRGARRVGLTATKEGVLHWARPTSSTQFGHPSAAARAVCPGKHPADLGAHPIRHLVERTGIDPEAVEDVVYGCLDNIGAQAGNIGRTCALVAGLPDSVPGTTVDRQYGSGLRSIVELVTSGVRVAGRAGPSTGSCR